MYLLNKIVWLIANPAAAGCILLVMGFLLMLRPQCKRQRRFAVGLVGCSALWFYVWATPFFTRVVGATLEKPYLVNGRCPSARDFPVCDAIADMGGGVGADTNHSDHIYFNSSADRAYFSALLWKAGKAPVVMPSGRGLNLADRMLLLDLGVPDSAILVENEARNTEENARFVNEAFVHVDSLAQNSHRPRVLLVTSAWHMKRTLLMFEKFAPDLDVLPAACDFECVPCGPFRWYELLPNAEAFGRNAVYFHEWLGYWGYKLFRRKI